MKREHLFAAFFFAVFLFLIYQLYLCFAPFAASLVIETFGPAAFFAYTSVIHGLLIVITLYRMARRSPVPREARTRFVPLLRTSPVFFRLARRLSRKNRH